MQCKEFASVLEQRGFSPLEDAAQDHLAACSACQDFLADLEAIVATARELPAEIDPPQRIWISLRAQLEAEGLIKEPAVVVPEVSANWLENLRAWFTPRTLATAGVGLSLVIAAFLQLHKPHPPASPTPPAQEAKRQIQPVVPAPPVQTEVAHQNSPASQLPAKTQQTKRRVSGGPIELHGLEAAPSDDVYFARLAALNQAESDVPNSGLASNPALDESLRRNLRTVNEFIAECEAHLKKHPHDALAREYLNSAYQQKAELLAAMLDSGRSEQ